MKALKGELSGVKGQREYVTENDEVQEMLVELKQQMTEKNEAREGKGGDISFSRSCEGFRGRADWSEEKQMHKKAEAAGAYGAEAAMTAMDAELEQERKEKSAGTERIKDLEIELTGMKGSVMSKRKKLNSSCSVTKSRRVGSLFYQSRCKNELIQSIKTNKNA